MVLLFKVLIHMQSGSHPVLASFQDIYFIVTFSDEKQTKKNQTFLTRGH